MAIFQKFLFLFKSKYRRKSSNNSRNNYNFMLNSLLSCVLVLFSTLLIVHSVQGGGGPPLAKINCEPGSPEYHLTCQNGGRCDNGSCICPQGWAGPLCQYCYGKVKAEGSSGWISDGYGNYTANMKCTWLIESSSVVTLKNKTTRPSPIILHLEQFATECGWDHLYVYDGDNVYSPVLAVFSGLLVQNNYQVLRLPEVIAKSGYALVHFYTDVAYNLTGFNITYRTRSCPSKDSGQECSGNGVCLDGICTCNGGYSGAACDVQKCPNNCSTRGICNMAQRKCECFEGFKGHDCSQITELGYWEILPSNSNSNSKEGENFDENFGGNFGSASHSALVVNDTLWIIGGNSLNYQITKESLSTSKYDLINNEWETVEAKDSSEVFPNVYGHSSVLFDNKIYIYGGVHDGKLGSRYVSNSVLVFDLDTFNWAKVTTKAGSCKRNMCGPLQLMGHSAVVINDKGNKSRHSRMVVIFGHSPKYGFTNAVQEFHFVSGQWNIVQTKGYPVSGSFGHSTTTMDSMTQKIYVYGGYRIGVDSSYLSNAMYSYEPFSRTWSLLESGPTGRFLHAGVALNGLVLIFGGNGHNDTAYSLGSKCFTQKVLVYDIKCDTWWTFDPPLNLPTDLARYGHSANLYRDSVYLYGGFNGFILNDLISYTPPVCESLNVTLCERKFDNLAEGLAVKCSWNSDGNSGGKCESVYAKEFVTNNNSYYNTVVLDKCYTKNHEKKKYELAGVGSQNCGFFRSCSACLQNQLDCVWCGTSCSFSKCKDSKRKALVSLDQCSEDDSLCTQVFHNCPLCLSEPNCVWTKEEQCVKEDGLLIRNETTTTTTTTTTTDLDREQSVCHHSCSEHTSCLNCTAETCLWCNNLNVCVDKNSYVISFPYGQCMSWSQSPTYCLSQEPKSISVSQDCEGISSCDKCLSLPTCGWCDSGDGTGRGKCLDGSSRYPLIVNETGVFPSKKSCQIKFWHFTNCPLCQCNGHSKCDDLNKCLDCDGYTEGDSCDTCIRGYFGNPANAGSCSTCDCFAHADTCNPQSGRCYCKTKGITGDHCERCDTQNNYSGDPANGGSCFYDLQIDYQFTFNLSKKEDRYYTQINFRNTPTKMDLDADFQIICSIMAKMNITVKTGSLPERSLLTSHNCTSFKHRFGKTEYSLGTAENTTFYVYVYDFTPPLWIQISFAQSPKLDLLHFFITFSTCFLFLLLVAAVLWKIKQKYDMYRRRQRLFVEMEQMASRPFAQVYLEIPKPPVNHSSLSSLRRRRKEWPSPIALEPCQGSRAAVLSLLVSLPTGSHLFAPPGQSGLCVGSALVSLSNPRKISFEPAIKNEGKNSKLRKSLPSHNLSTCI